jgi:hypothetical protein
MTRSQQIFDYNNMIEDFDYSERQALVDLHILPDDFEASDYYRMSKVLAAQPREKRIQDPEALLRSLGL